MATQSTDPSTGNTTQERTFRVEFETPRSGYSVRIHREKVLTDKNNVELSVVQQTFAFNEGIEKVMSMQAMIDLAAKYGVSPLQLIQDLAGTFDRLVDDRRAEIAAQLAAEAAAAAAAAAAEQTPG